MARSRKTTPAASGLRRDYLSFPEIVAQAVAAVAPSVTPGLLLPILFATAGNASWACLGFAGVALFFLTLQLNVFASRIASPGALYVYVAEGLGPFAGVIAGWSLMIAYFFVSAAGTTEIALTAANFLELVAGVKNTAVLIVLFSIAGLGGAWWFAHRDIKLSTRVSLAVEGTVVTLILALVAAWFLHKGTITDAAQLDFKGVTFDQFRLGLVFAFFAFVGFESASVLGTEARQPFVLIPRALIACVIAVAVFFVISSYGIVDALSGIAPGLDKETAPLVSLSRLVNVPWMGVILTAGILSSFFAGTLACVNAGARVLYTLAHRGLFHISARKVHHSNATPHAAIAFVSLFALAVSVGLTVAGVAPMDAINYLGTLSTFGFLFAYLMIAIAAPFYLKRRGELTAAHIGIAAVSIIMIAVAIEGSVYPVPDWPSSLIPYIFFALLILGIGHFLRLRKINPKELKALEKELLGDG